jgi:biopolymer transport protein ExbB
MCGSRRECVGLLLAGAACAIAPERFWTIAVAEDSPSGETADGLESADGTDQKTGDVKGNEDNEDNVAHSRLDELVHKLRQGGTTIVVQVLLSIFGLAVVLERLWSLRRSRIVPDRLLTRIDKLWEEHKYAEIEAACEKKNSPLACTLGGIVKHRRADFQTVSTIAGDIASREMRRHLQKLFPVVIVATLEPLLGLLGTIFGMIGAFDTVALAGEMGDASLLADDIAKALVTTAVGLSIAIPALFVYHFLKNRTLSLSSMLEEEVSDRVSRWFVLSDNKSANASKEVPTDES